MKRTRQSPENEDNNKINSINLETIFSSKMNVYKIFEEEILKIERLDSGERKKLLSIVVEVNKKKPKKSKKSTNKDDSSELESNHEYLKAVGELHNDHLCIIPSFIQRKYNRIKGCFGYDYPHELHNYLLDLVCSSIIKFEETIKKYQGSIGDISLENYLFHKMRCIESDERFIAKHCEHVTMDMPIDYKRLEVKIKAVSRDFKRTHDREINFDELKKLLPKESKARILAILKSPNCDFPVTLTSEDKKGPDVNDADTIKAPDAGMYDDFNNLSPQAQEHSIKDLVDEAGCTVLEKQIIKLIESQQKRKHTNEVNALDISRQLGEKVTQKQIQAIYDKLSKTAKKWYCGY